mmetsp:Transcript_33419/g.32467  ORF Transcript_33419/g.32467 Transcript_33419/m.32467 type:complete len:127 (+) Transcript_33419:418-798(+)|eukprot:CAMPEP_0170540514 /NCGR_PEP_ID=MMETSP0211-20121228/501_1 /TAXON_ID=311385 /ORGANISM="Pseudokeronopsis sp., Strain OXSARD2" /LENGTH=126 /DNA_ID=CAMNT_0010842949 /DNA_START=418 /DNA_END=798 /DNA_ORIENTATION=+
MNVALSLKEIQRVLKDGGVYMFISYGSPENRTLHFERAHLKFSLQTFQIAPSSAKSKDSIHYVYILRKQEGADEQCALNWPTVEAQVKKEQEEEELYNESDDDDEDYGDEIGGGISEINNQSEEGH